MKKNVIRKRLTDTEQKIMLQTVSVLESGGLILYPSDTVWGIGCDATNDEAIQALYALKGRETGKAMLVLLEEERKLNNYVEVIPDVAWDILEATDKPITIIYPKGKNLSKSICGEDGSIGIRVIKDDFFLIQVLRKFKKPLVSTSANLSKQAPQYEFELIDEAIKSKVDYVVHREKTAKKNPPSSIIKLGLHGDVKIIRK